METIENVHDTFARLMGELQGYVPSRAAGVAEHQAQAVGYVWGWQDAGGSPKDTQVSTDFGYAYGIHCALYALERQGYRQNIAKAFEQWCATGSVDYVEERRDN